MRARDILVCPIDRGLHDCFCQLVSSLILLLLVLADLVSTAFSL